MAEPERLNVAQFAARADCDARQVRRAIARGLLHRAPDGTLDSAQLDAAWRSPNRRTREREPRETSGELAAALLEKERSLAALRRLEFEQRANRLIEIEVARRVLFQAAREARDSWIAWPARIAPTLAARLGIAPDALLHELSRAVHEQLARLGDPDADFTHEP